MPGACPAKIGLVRLGQPAATTLAVLDGAGGPLTPSQISERMLVASASTTATLDC